MGGIKLGAVAAPSPGESFSVSQRYYRVEIMYAIFILC